MARIELDKVSLTFKVRRHGRLSLKEFVLRRLFRRSVNPVLKVRALQDVSLRANEGDRLAILGHNGAGKSTLLKVLAGIYLPSRGRRIVEGQVSSLFDIALGFEPDGTGWENIAYRGYLQGETPRSIKAKVGAIAEFSELGEFLDMPVRYYSAGMLVRLAFSIATAIEPEVLLVDEVLGVGDLAFQSKARQRMTEMMARARVMVMISHDLDYLSKVCSVGVWMDHGRVAQIGPVDEVIAAYTGHVQNKPGRATASHRAGGKPARHVAAGDGSQAAVWKLDEVPPGTYDVQVTWSPSVEGAVSAPFHVYDGERLLATVRINQQFVPFGTTAEGKVFQSLGTFTISEGPLRVVLTDLLPDDALLTEAIRVVQAPAGGPLVADNNHRGYHETGKNWSSHHGWGGYGNRYSYTAAGDGSETATWKVADLPPGEHEVLATWTHYMNRAPDAPYQIHDGDELLATVRVNQRAAPVGTAVNGILFERLGTFTLRRGELRVTLSNDAKGYVIANAIHVAPKPTWGPVIVRAEGPSGEEPDARQAAA